MTNYVKKDTSSSLFSLGLPVCVCFCLLVLAGLNIEAAEIDIQPRAHSNSPVRVKTIVDVTGSLQVETRDKKSLELPIEVNAELFYDQIGLPGEHFPAVRHYWDAKADFQFKDEQEQRRLRGDRRLIALQDESSLTNRFWSPYGMLQRQELDLLDVVGSAFPPENLLPGTLIDESDTWPVDDTTAGQLLRLSEVTSCDLTNSIKESTGDTTKIEVEGTVEGVAEGAKTTIEVRGKYHFDHKAKIVTWFALALREKREIGFAAPGFEVTARIRSARQAIKESDALPEELVAQARRKPSPGELLMDFESNADLRYRAALDRRWHLVSQYKSSAKLRLIDKGDLLTTCKIDRLNRAPATHQITLDGFQADVRTALDESCDEILSASESVNPQGVRILRVVAAGDISDTPIRWVYYHLSDDDGQRLSLIFTHEASMESRLEGIDESLTSSIAFLPRVEQDDPKQAARKTSDRF